MDQKIKKTWENLRNPLSKGCYNCEYKNNVCRDCSVMNFHRLDDDDFVTLVKNKFLWKWDGQN